MRLQVALFGLLSAVQLILMNATWQQATLTDSGAQLGVTGFDVAGSLTLIVFMELLTVFGVRYWRPVVARIAIGLVTALGVLILWSSSSAVFGQRHWLQSAIAIKTGIADWESQASAVSAWSEQPALAMSTWIVASLLTAWGLRAAFLKLGARKAKLSTSDWVD